MVTKGERRGGINEEFGINVYTLQYTHIYIQNWITAVHLKLTQHVNQLYFTFLKSAVRNQRSLQLYLIEEIK